ncbi:MAG: phosphotransferase [Bacillota bacterium]|nr:phosphotransferase [Bacillota bacterium]MDW7676588.1 phosphotransferase [Bacillota bacterium]
MKSRQMISRVLEEVDLADANPTPLGRSGASVLLVEKGNRKYVLKLDKTPDEGALLKNVLMSFLPRSRYLNKEILIYRQLGRERRKAFTFPKALRYQENRYLLMEYVHGTSGWDRKRVSDRELAAALIEFNQIGESLAADPLFSTHRSVAVKPVHKIVIWTVTKVLLTQGTASCFRCLKTLRTCVSKQQKLPFTFMIHRDLSNKDNNVLTTDENVCFFDFESVILEDKWVLQDLLDMAVSLDLRVNTDLVKAYLEKMKETGCDVSAIDVPTQLRMMLLFRMIQRIHSKKEFLKPFRQQSIRFFHNVLLDDGAYAQWFSEHVDIGG